MNEQVLKSQKQSDQALPTGSAQSPADRGLISPPTISLPKGGGAIRGIGEKFSANPVTGTGSMSVPISASPGRAGFGPQLALSYDSGSGNGLFGLGWSLSLPAITRKTDKGLPRYLDNEESDVFILSGAEDLVPVLDGAGRRPKPTPCTVYGKRFLLRRYRPRIEGLFALIERWTDESEPANIFWRTISRDNITTWYGRTPESRIADPADASRIFQWFICETHDDKGNVASYGYLPEDGQEVDRSAPQEFNRTDPQRTAMRYPKRIRYGNRAPFLPSMASGGTAWEQPDDTPGQWMFELVFDYGEHTGALSTPGAKLPLRADPFSSHRAGFEVRTYRVCHRVLMFHHFKDEPGVGLNCMVRSTDFEYSEPHLPVVHLRNARRQGQCGELRVPARGRSGG